MRILVFQHLDVEHPGVFREFWTAAGHAWQKVELDEGEPIPALEPYDLLVAMGGPMDVWEEDVYPWLASEKAAIRDWVLRLGKPFLGICLGHQLLGEALGGRVAPMAMPEVGLTTVDLTSCGQKDPILSGFGPRVEVFQWHGAEVSQLPAGTDVLASNGACSAQAIRYGRHAYGFQYHCEITSTTVDEWERIPAYRSSLEQALGKTAADRLASAVSPQLPSFRRDAQRLNDNLMALMA